MLILHSLGDHFKGDSAERLAELVAGAGGPAVLVVADEGAHNVDAYLRNLYARILRNQPLEEAAAAPESGPSTLLVYGTGGDRLLRFDGLMEGLGKQLGDYSGLVKKLLGVDSRRRTWPAPVYPRAHGRRIALVARARFTNRHRARTARAR